jgi:hypothetical protein
VSIDKTYFCTETCFLIFAAINDEIDLAPRINGKTLLSSSYKEQKQIA